MDSRRCCRDRSTTLVLSCWCPTRTPSCWPCWQPYGYWRSCRPGWRVFKCAECSDICRLASFKDWSSSRLSKKMRGAPQANSTCLSRCRCYLDSSSGRASSTGCAGPHVGPTIKVHFASSCGSALSLTAVEPLSLMDWESSTAHMPRGWSAVPRRPPTRTGPWVFPPVERIWRKVLRRPQFRVAATFGLRLFGVPLLLRRSLSSRTVTSRSALWSSRPRLCPRTRGLPYLRCTSSWCCPWLP